MDIGTTSSAGGVFLFPRFFFGQAKKKREYGCAEIFLSEIPQSLARDFSLFAHKKPPPLMALFGSVRKRRG
jgi:hypothetical protein